MTDNATVPDTGAVSPAGEAGAGTNTSPEGSTQPTSLLGGDAEPSSETPDAGQGEGADKPEDGDKDKPEGAPEKYEDFKFSENSNVDPEILGEFQEFAKGLNLTQEQAQGVIDIQEKMNAKNMEAWNQTLEGWENEIRNDPNLGGVKLQKTLATCAKARDKFGDDNFKAMLNQTGVGSHPAMMQFLHKIGLSIGEDSPADGQPGAAEKSLADKLYNNK